MYHKHAAQTFSHLLKSKESNKECTLRWLRHSTCTGTLFVFTTPERDSIIRKVVRTREMDGVHQGSSFKTDFFTSLLLYWANNVVKEKDDSLIESFNGFTCFLVYTKHYYTYFYVMCHKYIKFCHWVILVNNSFFY